MPLKIEFDHAQNRILTDRIAVKAAGGELISSLSENVWTDPITKTTMLQPRPLGGTWYTSNSGDDQKLTISDFGLGSGWENRYDQMGKGPWLCLKDSRINEAALSDDEYEKNRGFYCAWFSYGAGETFIQFRFGWNETATIEGGIAIDVSTDGRVNVYKGGVFIQSGRITGSSLGAKREGQVFEMMLIPCRFRELLIVSLQGDGFVTVFEDIEDSDESPEITPAGKVWFEVPIGATQVQIAPLRFAESGTAFSTQVSFLEPPLPGEDAEVYHNDGWLDSPAPYRLFGHPAFVGTQTAAASLSDLDGSAFSADGIESVCRLKVDLTTDDSGYSPFIYGAMIGFGGLTDSTDDSEQAEITQQITSASLSVPNSADGSALDITIADPSLAEAFIAGIKSICSRPVLATLDDVHLFDGVSCAPEFGMHWSSEVERCRIEIRDRWKLLEEYRFSEALPLDGLRLTDVLAFLAGCAGFLGDEVQISDTDFHIPFAPGVSGEFGSEIEIGDTAAEWILRLIEDFASNWEFGVKPTPGGSIFYALSPEDLPVEPSLTLYTSIDDAIVLGEINAEEAWQHVVREIHFEVLEPLANDIRVTGQNPRTRQPFQAHKADLTSMDPSLAPSDRPNNWLGSPRRYALVDPSLTTQEAVNYAAAALFERLTPAREMIGFRSDMLLQSDGTALWRGDLIRIEGVGDFRIAAFGCDFVLEHDDFIWRDGIYTAERVIPTP